MDRVIRYTRKLSGDEALERYVMVLKDSLKLFPKPGMPFKVKVNGEVFDSEVRIVDCWCQGPKKPHVHYRIDLTPFIKIFRPHFGQIITFEKTGESEYQLS